MQSEPVHPVLEEAVRAVCAVGLTLVLILPSARGVHAQLGWLPMWLVGMPLVAWWSLHRFRLPIPRFERATERPVAVPVRPVRAQAHRRGRASVACPSQAAA